MSTPITENITTVAMTRDDLERLEYLADRGLEDFIYETRHGMFSKSEAAQRDAAEEIYGSVLSRFQLAIGAPDTAALRRP